MNGHMYITGQLICEDRGKQPGGKKKRKKKRNVRVTQKHTHSLETSVPVFQLELIVHLANWDWKNTLN